MPISVSFRRTSKLDIYMYDISVVSPRNHWYSYIEYQILPGVIKTVSDSIKDGIPAKVAY